MDLFKDWQELQETVFKKEPIDKSTIMESIKINSQDVLSTLDRRLSKKMLSGGFLTLLSFIILSFNLDNVVLLIACGTMSLIFTVMLALIWNQIRQIRRQRKQTAGLLLRMQTYHKYITKVMRLENVLGILLFPFAAIAGQAVGYYLSEGSITLEDIYNNNTFLIASIVLIIVLTPAGVWLTNYLNNRSFSDLLKQLEGYIRQLESLD